MANTLKINSTCPASHVQCVILMVLFFFVFFIALDNGNRTTAFVAVWSIAEAIYDQCYMLPAEFAHFAEAVLLQSHFF